MTVSETDRVASARWLVIAMLWLSWGLALGSLAAMIVAYETLPEELPITRWHSASKTWFLAVRIPLSNLLSLGIIQILGRILFRCPGNTSATWIQPVLAVTAGTKSLTETLELLELPQKQVIFPMFLVAIVVTGVGVSLWFGRDLLKDGNWRSLNPAFHEKLAIAILAGATIVLYLPLL